MDTPVNPADQALARLREKFQGHPHLARDTPHRMLGDWVATLHDPKASVEATVVHNTAEELHKALTVEPSRATHKPMSEPTKWVRW